ncbi:fimbrial protein [Pantoea sp. PNT02]|jgi:P pilus assembly chaperone PapD|uniref:fimbrial protein n=1 Tax=Pantoea sp. PNT02 TaxID=2769261 RepID=UPI00177E875F|nr:fimbrial protein [Pantoea sp. PNT02]MBD9646049.1 fimbrial protein [Pantoea sp. PNT02]
MDDSPHKTLRHGLSMAILSHNTLVKKLAYPLILMGFISMPAAWANMSVYPMEVTLNNQGAAQVQTLSQSGEAQFIRVSIKRIERPATPFEKEILVEDAVSPSLIATPDKFALASGSQRIIRLISLQPPEKETAWRVYFEAVAAPDELKDKSPQNNNISNQVGINLVWGVLVHIPPRNARLSLTQSASGEVKNAGTVRVVIREVAVCSKQHSSSSCQWKKEHATVYPDETLRFKAWSSAELAAAQEVRIKHVDLNTRNIAEYVIGH